MGLTWQDVAGQVRSSDFSGSANMITKGLEQLSGALQAPERLRQEQLDREMKGLMMQSEVNTRTGNMIDRIDTKQKNEIKERDMKEFGAAQSTLEALSRSTAMKGGSYEDVLKSDAYQGLSEGARAYGASNLSDAFMRGDETRLARIEDDQDDARAQSNSDRSYNQSAQQHRDSVNRANRELDLREREYKKREREERESRGFISDDPKTNAAWRQRAAQTASQVAPIMEGMAKYGKMSTREAAKLGETNENFFRDGPSEAQAIAKAVQEKTGKRVDDWMINKLLAEGGNADNWDFNTRGTFDQGAAEEYLTDLVKLKGAAEFNQQFFDQMTVNARSGTKYDVERLQNFPIQLGVDPAKTPKRSQTNNGNPGSILQRNPYMK